MLRLRAFGNYHRIILRLLISVSSTSNTTLIKAGTPVSKTQEAPRQPNINDPNYYDQVFKYGTQQVRVRSYSGAGTATLQHYSDGRWVLTNVQFNFVGVNASVEVR